MRPLAPVWAEKNRHTWGVMDSCSIGTTTHIWWLHQFYIVNYVRENKYGPAGSRDAMCGLALEGQLLIFHVTIKCIAKCTTQTFPCSSLNTSTITCFIKLFGISQEQGHFFEVPMLCKGWRYQSAKMIEAWSNRNPFGFYPLLIFFTTQNQSDSTETCCEHLLQFKRYTCMSTTKLFKNSDI